VCGCVCVVCGVCVVCVGVCVCVCVCVCRGKALIFLSPLCYSGMGGEYHTSVSLPLRKRNCTHCIAAWLDPRSVPDGFRKPSSPFRVTIPITLSQSAKYFMYKFNKKGPLLLYKAVGTLHSSHS